MKDYWSNIQYPMIQYPNNPIYIQYLPENLHELFAMRMSNSNSNVKFCCLIITHCPAKYQLKTNIKHHNQQNKILPEIQYMYSNKTSVKVCEKIGINIVKSLKFVSEKIYGSHVGTNTVRFSMKWECTTIMSCWLDVHIDHETVTMTKMPKLKANPRCTLKPGDFNLLVNMTWNLHSKYSPLTEMLIFPVITIF